jgi:hypothetical protein
MQSCSLVDADVNIRAFYNSALGCMKEMAHLHAAAAVSPPVGCKPEDVTKKLYVTRVSELGLLAVARQYSDGAPQSVYVGGGGGGLLF